MSNYPVRTLELVHTALRDKLDEHATLPAQFRFYNASEALIGTVTLEKPCGSVDAGTGQLTFLPDSGVGSANGTAARMDVLDGAGVFWVTMPCVEGVEPVSGSCVMPSLAIEVGSPIVVTSATIG